MTPSTAPTWDDSNLNLATIAQRETKEWAIANTLSSVQARIKQDTANAIAAYEQQWSDYCTSRLNHPELTIVPPTPAVQEIVVYDGSGWPASGPGNTLVCAPHVYQTPANVHPSLTQQQVADEFNPAGAGSASPFNNSAPMYGPPVTAPDGSQWVRVK